MIFLLIFDCETRNLPQHLLIGLRQDRQSDASSLKSRKVAASVVEKFTHKRQQQRAEVHPNLMCDLRVLVQESAQYVYYFVYMLRSEFLPRNKIIFLPCGLWNCNFTSSFNILAISEDFTALVAASDLRILSSQISILRTELNRVFYYFYSLWYLLKSMFNKNVLFCFDEQRCQRPKRKTNFEIRRRARTEVEDKQEERSDRTLKIKVTSKAELEPQIS